MEAKEVGALVGMEELVPPTGGGPSRRETSERQGAHRRALVELVKDRVEPRQTGGKEVPTDGPPAIQKSPSRLGPPQLEGPAPPRPLAPPPPRPPWLPEPPCCQLCPARFFPLPPLPPWLPPSCLPPWDGWMREERAWNDWRVSLKSLNCWARGRGAGEGAGAWWRRGGAWAAGGRPWGAPPDAAPPPVMCAVAAAWQR